MTAIEFWDSLPHCVGYPNCDGDLVGEHHSEGCPLFGRKELSIIEFAQAYGNQMARECVEICMKYPNRASSGSANEIESTFSLTSPAKEPNP